MLDEPGFHGIAKSLLNEFSIHYRLEGCMEKLLSYFQAVCDQRKWKALVICVQQWRPRGWRGWDWIRECCQHIRSFNLVLQRVPSAGSCHQEQQRSCRSQGQPQHRGQATSGSYSSQARHNTIFSLLTKPLIFSAPQCPCLSEIPEANAEADGGSRVIELYFYLEMIFRQNATR